MTITHWFESTSVQTWESQISRFLQNERWTPWSYGLVGPLNKWPALIINILIVSTLVVCKFNPKRGKLGDIAAVMNVANIIGMKQWYICSFFFFFNDACRAHWFSNHRLLDINHKVIVAYFYTGNLLSPHRPFSLISSKGSFICTFPQTEQHIWRTSCGPVVGTENSPNCNSSAMQDRSAMPEDPNLYSWVLYHLRYAPPPKAVMKTNIALSCSIICS